MTVNKDIILKVANFSAGFEREGEILRAVDDISFELLKGETLGIVGESGCGKSVTALSIMRLLPVPSGRYLSGEILFDNRNLLTISSREMYGIRGNRIAMIFQEPMTALNPVKKIGKQIGEVFEIHKHGMNPREILSETIELLEKVGISEPQQRLNEYPHQLSGGMRQRVMIAMALACRPDILIADEPTTALDVTIQAQILDLIVNLQKEYGMSVIFITHDLGVVANLSDNVVVMYAGKIVEKGGVHEIFKKPSHPYTQGLLDSIPRFLHHRKTRLKSIEGMVPSISDYPAGCRFLERCEYAFNPCGMKHPDEYKLSSTHTVNCYKFRADDGTDS